MCADERSPGTKAWVALGANVGDAHQTLARALRALGTLAHTRVEAVSTIHVTAPIGPSQPYFHNAVVRLRTTLAPHALLDALLRIEGSFFRQRTVVWGPRTLDLDLILYGDHAERVIDLPALKVPHLLVCQRLFVLDPLLELDPDLIHPETGLLLRAHRDALISAARLL